MDVMTIAKIVTGALLVFTSVLALMYARQERLIFHPDVLSNDHGFQFADTREVALEVAGARLSALHMKLPNAKGVVFYLHGNGGSLESWFPGANDFFRQANFDLFMIDYRGYGKSSGHIGSEAELHADVLKAFQHVAPQYAGHPVVVLGRSIGTGLAAELALQVKPTLTILVSPYTSLSALAGLHYPWLPSFLLRDSVLRYQLDTARRIPQIATPVLLIHGGLDQIIPANQSLDLQTRAAGVGLVLIPEAGHNDIHNFPAYRDAILKRLQAL